MRESWWLLVVAAFVYLALILATYSSADPGWSFSGSGEPLRNRGGVVGAWLADLLLYVFGASAWWWVFAGVVLVVTGYRHLTRDDVERHHVWLAVPGFLPGAAFAARRWKRCACIGFRSRCRDGAGGALGELIGNALSRGDRFQRSNTAC